MLTIFGFSLEGSLSVFSIHHHLALDVAITLELSLDSHQCRFASTQRSYEGQQPVRLNTPEIS
jgi:hypothetical protein